MAPSYRLVEADISQSTVDTHSEYESQNRPGDVIKAPRNMDCLFQVQYIGNPSSHNRHVYVVRPISLWSCMERYKNFIG